MEREGRGMLVGLDRKERRKREKREEERRRGGEEGWVAERSMREG